MDRHLRYIVVLTVCIILCNQFIHLYSLYKGGKAQYVYQQNSMIMGAVYEFNMKAMNLEHGVSFNVSTNELTYIIDQQITKIQLSAKDNILQVSKQSEYDIQNPQAWTLKNFYTCLQTKQDSIHQKNLSMQLAILDSTGRIKDSYPGQLESLPVSPEYRESLGFISGDTLYAAYNYPFVLFIQVAVWSILLTIIISVLFIICIVNLWQTIRNEKKSGEYRELFIGNLVHDLKRPVSNQIKVCYLLREKLPGKQASMLEQSQKQLNEMLQSINRMLFQFTDAHGLRLSVREFNFREMLEVLTQKERWNTQTGKQFDIQVDFRSDNPMIIGDVDFLFAVFQNFIDNALKYSDDHVSIRIMCTDLDIEHVQICISDNGFGISSRNLKQVFERYSRGDHQVNAKIKGHGQGLHYARTVILAHGGKISIESQEGEGTTILVVLPRKANIKNKYKH